MTAVEDQPSRCPFPEFVLPAAAVIAALTIRLYLLFTFRYPLMIHEQDAAGYIDVARKILSFSPFFDTFRPPAYPAVIALVAPFAPDIETAARLASIIMDSLVVVPLYYLGRVFLNRPAALAATMLWSFFSFALYFSPSPLSQSTYLFFLLTAIVLLYQGLVVSPAPARLAGAGALFALAYLGRPEGVVGFGCAVMFALVHALTLKGPARRRVLLVAATVAGFVVVAGPYIIYLRQATGFWALTGKSDAAVKTLDAIFTLDASGNLPASKGGITVWKEHYGTLGNFLSEVGRNIGDFTRVYLGTYPLWVHICGAAGALWLLFRRRWLILFPLILIAVTLPNYIVNIPKSHSYIYSIFPVLFIAFAAAGDAFGEGVAALYRRIRPGASAHAAPIATAVILAPVVTFIAYQSVQDALGAFRSPGLVEQAALSRDIYGEAASLLRQQTRPGDLVMTRWGIIGYFADRRTVTLPKGGVREVLDYGRRNGVSYVVIDTVSVLSRRQELADLLNPLQGAPVDPALGIVPVGMNLHPGLGGWIVYRYR